jgi:hypothetical protein
MIIIVLGSPSWPLGFGVTIVLFQYTEMGNFTSLLALIILYLEACEEVARLFMVSIDQVPGKLRKRSLLPVRLIWLDITSFQVSPETQKG